LVTGNGCEILTTTSKELDILTSVAFERIV
jgi:hypothetical protein